ncbi:TIGR03279 family radical SAM protein [Nodularia spumigena]|jgi:putative radical SAM enzyme (TIGR03279 family)|uniref:TIGR03279 family radical SAM protein n=1 Tax=Nodularia spumigena UHCC 0060 TaxID=3110300 RepID=A0ABU5USE3_NODSP|nr:TIGR03279 family radical SAM protein [Nodularia spumigena]MEA5524588.1 TIGR03279 family radical SAM protein [Nodularia spumigena UHCC 0143]MEA5608877.1 TIGR03279 family radical SAM protein [Nodularia spumigena UHCC 0060]MEA5615037.1 TIGR03279 family radical SAM protein [Nodularia spumigena UHCC 0040]
MSTIRPAQITRVLPDSIAAEIGFDAGDAIVAINGTQPRDLIDYQFLCADQVLELEVLDASGKTHHIEIEKDYDEDLGLEFETALFDGLIQCNNHCPFCFIDQQPPGKRSTLYLKDDDYRLSFLYGSYLTLTNLSAKEWERIEQMRLSPLFVSVHATEPEIRIRLLKNQRAGQILQQIKWFQDRRLQIHAQVVVCPGINDGQHLQQTLKDLASFHSGEIPAVASVAVVPVGLTRFRPEEDELIPVTREKAQEVISQVNSISGQFRQQFGSAFAWLADEWFLIAGEELPSEAEYEEYPQIDNGVGSIRLFIKQFASTASQLLPQKLYHQKKLTWVVGNAVEKAFQPILQRLNAVEGLEVNMQALFSDYWGQNISVTGLITGHDLLLHLSGKDLGDGILLPKVMLKNGELVFLDDMTVAEVAEKLHTEIFPVAGIEELINKCIAEGVLV